jgi:diguanylate cyclase (GGDEF)-like protein/PAS domain S-box-containing protein
MADSAPVLIWMSGNDKLCHYFNKVWLDFTGRTLAQESGNGWAEGIHPEDYQRCLDIYFSHFERRIPFQMEYRLKRHDGVYRWIVDSGTPLFEVGGVFSGYIGSCIDIDDSRQAAQKLKDDEALMSFALEGAGDSIWDWNVPTGEVALTGVGAAMFGYTESEASHHIEDWFALIPEEDQVRWREMLHNFFHEKSEKFSIEYRVCNRDGRTLWIMTRGMVWEQGADGRVTRMIGVHTDITQRKQSEDALRISADEIEDLYNHAPCGYHSFDKDEIIQRINDTELEWLGYTRDEVEGKLKMTDLLTHSSAQLFHKNFVLLKKRDLLNDIELEFLRKNGTVLNGLINSTVIRDTGGKYLKCRSTVFDISERKKTEETLRSLFTALEHGPIAVIITDAYANIQYVSPRFSEITGYAHADVLGRNLRILQASQISKFTYLEMWSALSNGHTWHGELLNHHKQGRAYWEDVHITPVKTLEGIVTNYVVVSADITERKMAEEQMKHLANFDPLTDLPNRSLVDDRLSQALAVAKRDKTLIALMFLDLDKFKPINDTFGHDVGDLVLKEVARRMLDCVRASDTIGRIGGDEFVVLLPTLDSDQHAVLVAEKIRHALNQPFELAGQELHISSSIGVALYPEHGEEGKTLVKNADCAMYCAKEAGRDNVQLFRKVMLES